MEDTKVEGTKTKKRSRNVKEVPTERLRTIPSVLFPVILQINIEILNHFSVKGCGTFICVSLIWFKTLD